MHVAFQSRVFVNIPIAELFDGLCNQTTAKWEIAGRPLIKAHAQIYHSPSVTPVFPWQTAWIGLNVSKKSGGGHWKSIGKMKMNERGSRLDGERTLSSRRSSAETPTTAMAATKAKTNFIFLIEVQSQTDGVTNDANGFYTPPPNCNDHAQNGISEVASMRRINWTLRLFSFLIARWFTLRQFENHQLSEATFIKNDYLIRWLCLMRKMPWMECTLACSNIHEEFILWMMFLFVNKMYEKLNRARFQIARFE